jgi:hypothetical protein
MAPAEYAALFHAPLLYDDRELTRALIEARTPRPERADTLASAPAISIAAGGVIPGPVAAGLALPPAGTVVRRNPLYVDGAVRWPSERYAKEYGGLATYPMQAAGPESAVAGSDPQLEELVRRRVLLDLPASW